MPFSIGRCKSVVALAIGIACSLAVPCQSAAQAVSGTISGNVADPQGQVLPGATLTIINEATNDPRVTVSDGSGGFQVTNLQPGQYTIRVEMQNFRTLERKDVVLSAGERLSVGTLTLAIGNLGETVVVEARGTQVNVAETQHSGLITAKQIEQVQVLGRDVTSIMRLLTIRNKKSNAMARPIPIDRAISEGMAPFGTTRS